MIASPSLLIALGVAWFILYWIFGGVLFSIIAVLKVGRVHKARFGCLFTLLTAGMGGLAAWAGLQLSAVQIATCPAATSDAPLWVDQFSCGIIGILGTFFVGFLLVLVVGAALISLFTSRGTSWIEASPSSEEGTEKEDYDHHASPAHK